MEHIIHPTQQALSLPDYEYTEYSAPSGITVRENTPIRLKHKRSALATPQPKELPFGAVFATCTDSTGDKLLVGTDYTPCFFGYVWDGTRYIGEATPMDIPPETGVHTITGTSDLSSIVLGMHAEPYASFYVHNGTQYTRVQDADIMPTDDIGSASMTETGQYLVMGGHLNDNVYLYKWNPFEMQYQRLPDPDVSPVGHIESVCFAPGTEDAPVLLIGTRKPPYFFNYKLDTGSSVFKHLSLPDRMPQSKVLSVAASNEGSHVILGCDKTPFIMDYFWNGTFYELGSSPDVLPTVGVRAVSISLDGQHVVCGEFGKPYIDIYERAENRLARQVNPRVLPTQGVRSISLTPDASRLIVGAYSPDFILTYNNYDYIIEHWKGSHLNPEQYAFGFSDENLIAGIAGKVRLYFYEGLGD